MKTKNTEKRFWRYLLGLALFVLLGMAVRPGDTGAADYVTMNGKYKINTKVNGSMLLDVAGGSSKDGANIQIYQDNKSTAQQFNVKHIGSGWHQILNAASGKSLDVAGASTKSGANVQLYKSNNTNAQKWRFISAGGGYYYIQNKLGFYLDVAGGKSANGTNVCVYKINYSNAQKWKMINITDPTGVKLNTKSITLTSIGAKQRLTATISPSTATNKNIKWESSDSNVATVSNGTVQAVGSGETTISASTVNGKIAKAKVTVKDGCAEIKEGYYCWNSKVSSNMMLDVSANSTANEANIQIYKNNGSMAQKFYVKKAGYGWYYVYNAYPSQCMDVKGGLKAQGTNVQLHKNNGSDAQKWRFYSAGNGYYYVMNKLGCYLDVDGAKKNNATNVRVWGINKSDAQKWKLTGTKAEYANIAGGCYHIISKVGSNMMLDVAGNGRDNGTNINIYKKNNSMGQIFKVESTKDGWYKITHLFSKKCLDVSGGKQKDGSNVQLYDPNNSDAQKWRFVLSADKKYFTIISKLGNSKKKICLDVASGSNKNGANVAIYGENNTAAQRWELKEANMIELTGIKLNPGSVSLKKGETKNISVSYVPSNATAANTVVDWSTSNGGVATVSSSGKVTAVGAGKATITARSYNGKTASVTVEVKSQEQVYNEQQIRITQYGQTVDTFNGVAARYIPGTGNSNYGDYCCAGYVMQYYSRIYGITVTNMFTGKKPVASRGSFSVTGNPLAGDIGYQTNGGGSGHWFIIKSVNADGSLTVIEQNWKYNRAGSTYCTINRKVRYGKTPNLKVFRWSGR